MGKWIIAVDDEDDAEVQHMADTANVVFIKEWGEYGVAVKDLERATLGDVD
jgi:hypothetical protein